MTITFTHDDVRLFARASGDANRLHLCPSYCRRTAFGRPVVHGVLGVLASLGSLKARRGQRIAQINAEFPGAMFTDIDYTVHVLDGPGDRARISVADGTRTMLEVEVRFQSGEEPRVEGEGAGQWPRERPAETILTDPDTRPIIQGAYRPDARHLQEIIDRHCPAGSAAGRGPLGVLLCASYLTGMELPGARSLLAGFSIEFESPPEGIAWPQRFTAGVTSLDDRFDLLRCAVDVTSRNRPVARLEITSFLRPDVDASQRAMTRLPSSAQTMKGKVAVVTGASRGLGACLTAGLVARGGTVYANYRESHEQALALQRDLAGAPGKMILARGDAGDAAWWRRLRGEIEADSGGLDVLICNACPPLVPLSLDPANLGRIETYIRESVSYVAGPLAIVGDLVCRRAGWIVMVSSSAVEEPPPMWPHYVAAKRAVEGLAEAAAVNHRSAGVLIVRPPRMTTDLTSVPMGHAGAIAPALVATTIIDRLDGPRVAAKPVCITEFATGNGPVRAAA